MKTLKYKFVLYFAVPTYGAKFEEIAEVWSGDFELDDETIWRILNKVQPQMLQDVLLGNGSLLIDNARGHECWNSNCEESKAQLKEFLQTMYPEALEV